MDARVLLIEQDLAQREEVAHWLRNEGFEVVAVQELGEATRSLRGGVSVIVSGLPLTGAGARSLMREAARVLPGIQTIVMNQQDRIEDEIVALRSGAFEVLSHPIRPHRLLHLVRHAARMAEMAAVVRQVEDERRGRFSFSRLVGSSIAMSRVRDRVRQVADTRATVLLVGEAGVGKETIARILHQNSSRFSAPFVPVHCEVIPESLLEGELFGRLVEETLQPGRLSTAAGGTLFLEEVQGLSLDHQGKLLRILESRRFLPVGTEWELEADIRLIATSSHDLGEAVARGDFRSDLYEALGAIRIPIPALRDRREDLCCLVQALSEEICRDNDRPVPPFTQDAIRALERFSWPGNIRQLRSCLERVLLLTRGPVIDLRDLPPAVTETLGYSRGSSDGEDNQDAGSEASALAGLSMSEIERAAIVQTLALTGGNRTQTARLLGIGLRTLHRKMIQYELR